MKRIERRKALVWAMKYIPVIGTIVYTIHAGLLLMGQNMLLAEFLVIVLNVSVLVWMLSTEFHFCLLHKCLIGYVTLFNVCILLQRLDLFGAFLVPARWIMFVLGIILMIWLFIRFKNFKEDEC